MKGRYELLVMAGLFGLAWFLPVGSERFQSALIEAVVGGNSGGNSLGANLFVAVAGALMCFATLTEVPILEGPINSGMGKGPALSLPNMLVIRSVLGTKKTAAFVRYAVLLSTVAGMVYGASFK